jgi:hypothetical protein
MRSHLYKLLTSNNYTVYVDQSREHYEARCYNKTMFLVISNQHMVVQQHVLVANMFTCTVPGGAIALVAAVAAAVAVCASCCSLCASAVALRSRALASCSAALHSTKSVSSK